MRGNLVGVSDEDRRRHVDAAKQLSLSLLYWLQTEAPRPDGKSGWRELRLRGDIVGTEDGVAKYPYVREARRIRAVTTVLEQHCGTEARAAETGRPAASVTALEYPDSVGIGSYRIDLHPTSAGDNYIDFASLPFQVPLGALLPVRTENLIAACKNIGTTHVTNGCYRLHPVEWNIGEAAGSLAAFAAARRVQVHAVRDTPALLADYQKRLIAQGVELRWPPGGCPPGLQQTGQGPQSSWPLRCPGALLPAAPEAGLEEGDADPAVLHLRVRRSVTRERLAYRKHSSVGS